MPKQKGDFYLVVPLPALRSAMRRAACDADVSMRSLATSFLVSGLSGCGYKVEGVERFIETPETAATEAEVAAD